MDRAVEPERLVVALDRAVAAICSDSLDLRDPDRLVLDLARIESEAETWKSTIQVLMKHLSAA